MENKKLILYPVKNNLVAYLVNIKQPTADIQVKADFKEAIKVSNVFNAKIIMFVIIAFVQLILLIQNNLVILKTVKIVFFPIFVANVMMDLRLIKKGNVGK